jgi:crossover junction endodeoxyribonuclease RusA
MIGQMFRVAGVPAPQGSKKALNHRHTGKTILVEQSGPKLKAWRDVVTKTAAFYFRGQMITGPVSVQIVFFLPRPASVGRVLPDVRPDADKLARAVLDALTGVAFADDAQVCDLFAGKRYAPPGVDPGATITVQQMEDSDG